MSDFVTIFNPFFTGGEVSSAAQALADAGGRLLQAWGGPVLIAEGDDSVQAAVRAVNGVALVTSGPIPSLDWMGLVPQLEAVLGAWNMGLSPDYLTGVNDFLNLQLPGDEFLAPGGCVRMISAVEEGLQAVAGFLAPCQSPGCAAH